MTQTLQNRRVALVGGAGFIGHNLALRLKQQGAHVEVVDGLQVNNLLSFSTGAGVNRELSGAMIPSRAIHRTTR